MKRYKVESIGLDDRLLEDDNGEYVLLSDIVQLVENSRFAERALYTGEFIKREILSAIKKGDGK